MNHVAWWLFGVYLLLVPVLNVHGGTFTDFWEERSCFVWVFPGSLSKSMKKNYKYKK